jgi:alkaline phosphatase D
MSGDFIYEGNTVATAPAGRNVYPPKEIVTLQDYRLRYQTYHTDPELVRMRAALPLIGKLCYSCVSVKCSLTFAGRGCHC